MNVVCPKCNEKLAEVQSVARLTLTVHCPFDGHDFGVAVDPPVAGSPELKDWVEKNPVTG